MSQHERLCAVQKESYLRLQNLRVSVSQCFCAAVFSIFLQPAALSSELLNKGIAAFNSGDYASAVQLLREAKKRDFENASLHYYLGNALVKLRRNQEAIQEFKVALDLNPEGKVAEYCRASLNVLVPAPVKPVQAKENVSAPPKVEKIQQPSSQQPVIYAYLDGSPASDRAVPILADLQTQFGDKMNFVRGHKGGDANSGLLTQNRVTECPTIMLFDNQGRMIKKFEKMFSEELLRKEVVALVPTTNMTRHIATEDKALAMSRKAIVDEYNARVSAGRRQLEEEIKMARREIENEMAGRDTTLSYSDNSTRNSIETRALDRTSKMKEEFLKRKREWYEHARHRLQGLGIKDYASELVSPVDGAD